jgi:SAM-dependent methyltransferase
MNARDPTLPETARRLLEAQYRESLAARPQPLPVTLEQVAAESLAVEPASFDVALARNSVMYFTDLPAALANIRRALRTGGRYVASVYGPLEREPFHEVPIAAVQRRCRVNAPYPDYVQAFQVSADDVERALQDAGLRTVERHVVPTGRSFPSLAAALDALRLSRSLAQLLSALPEGQREDAWSDIQAGFRAYDSESGLRIPGEQVVLTATA